MAASCELAMERYDLQDSPMNNRESVQHTGDLSPFTRSMQEDRVTLETGVSYVYLEEDGGRFKRTPANLATPYVLTPALARAQRASRSRSPPLLSTYIDHSRAEPDSTLRWQTCQDEVDRLRRVVANFERQIAEFKGQKDPQRDEEDIDLRDLVRQLHAEKEGLLRKVQEEEGKQRRMEHGKEREGGLKCKQDVEWTHKQESIQQPQARCADRSCTPEAQEQEQIRFTAQRQKDEDASSPAFLTIKSKEPYFPSTPSFGPTVLLTKAPCSGATNLQK